MHTGRDNGLDIGLDDSALKILGKAWAHAGVTADNPLAPALQPQGTSVAASGLYVDKQMMH